MAEMEELGLLALTADEQAQFAAEFISRLSVVSSINCDLITGIGYIHSQAYGVRCANGTSFVARVSDDGIYGMNARASASLGGGAVEDAIWFIGVGTSP